ncbi:unnamed protein product [Rotaria sp. Silwood1]|nr:unnamed protein product [Rotaria sp. Silwood1]CAF1425498.1 unnamed protein product [Rotaria sp. Silwood1]CAF3637144.1 unnamed protein product [Rotaria sp. Silwood1]CAF3644976.1 unnamed protein product [Rotaria sp. Silwood1]
MDLQIINVELFKKLSLAIAIIRNTPDGITPDVFTRILSKRLFPRSNHSSQLASILDEHLILRQQDLLSRFLPSHTKLTSSISFMDFTPATIDNDDLNKKQTNEYEYGEFAEKVFQLKDKKYQIKIDDVEFLLNTLTKWIITTTDINYQTIPIDACLYTIQIIANNLKTDNDKPYHIVLDILPMINKFLDCLFDILDHITDNHVYFIHEMIISLASSNSCVSRILDKLCYRLRQYCENIEIINDNHREYAANIHFIDPIDRLFNILHEIIHNRSIFQRRLSQRSIDKLFTFINQISSLLDGKSNHTHLLKLQGQLQAANYKITETSIKTFRSYTSSSSSDYSQCQQQKHYTTKPPPLPLNHNSLDYSMSQHSQSQYF